VRTGAKDVQTSSDEESKAEVVEEEEESDAEFCDRAVWVQLCQQLWLGQGSSG
jgi:hypothetical protein